MAGTVTAGAATAAATAATASSTTTFVSNTEKVWEGFSLFDSNV